MVDLADQTLTKNTVFDLSIRLGVRTQVVLDTLNTLGLEIDDPMAPLDPLVEERLVGRMVQSGQVARRALKTIRKHREPQQPLANDKILKEALGASQRGYSDKALPPQVAQLAAAQKSSLLERLGLRRPRGREEPELLEAIPVVGSETTPRPAPPQVVPPTPGRLPPSKPRAAAPVTLPTPEHEEEEQVDLDRDLEGLAEEMPLKHDELLPAQKTEPDRAEKSVPPSEAAPLTQAQPKTPEGVSKEVDLGDLRLSDEDEEELGSDLDETALEELLAGEGDEDIFQGLEELGLGELPAPHEEKPEVSAPEEKPLEEEIAVEVEEEEAEGEKREEEVPEKTEPPQEEEVPLGLLERIVLKLDLSPLEMIIAAVGSLLVMVTALGLTVYYYLNYSPQKAESLFDRGHAAYHYDLDTLGETRFDTIIDSFTRLRKRFPDDHNVEQAAYLLAKAFYRRAEEVAKTDPTTAKMLYADTVEYFEEFLREQRRISDRRVQRGQSGYMRIDWEEDARYHIGLAYEKQPEYEKALAAYEAFLSYYSKSARAPEVRIKLGDIYRDWARVNENLRAERLQKAIEKYQEALADPSCSDELRVALHTAIAGINRVLYDTSQQPYRPRFLEATLQEYRKAQQIVLAGDSKGLGRHNVERDLALGLADTLLTLGEEATALVRSMTGPTAAYYPRSDRLRDILAAEAQKEKTAAEKHLSEAAYLYSKLLGTKPFISFVPENATGASREILSVTGDILGLTNGQIIRIKGNLAEAYFHMGMCDETINIASPLISELRSHDPESQRLGPLCYLMGDAAWELGEYDALVLTYYDLARQYNPFFPEGSGERSNEAALKMANVYYSRGMDSGDPGYLESAILEYNRILSQFPQTNWTYFTRYWLARTYDRYADVLSDANSPAYSPDKAKKNYQYAYMQYQLALQARSFSAFVDKKHPDAMKECYFRSGLCAYQAGDLSQARDLLADAIIWSNTGAPGDPGVIPCRELLGDIYLELGHPDRAIAIYNNYLVKKYQQQDSRGDSLSRVSLKLARAYLRCFSYDQARDEVLRGLVRDNPVIRKPGSSQVEEGPGLEAQRLLAQSYRDEAETLSDPAEKKPLLSAADREYQTLLAMNPNEHEALRALAETNFDLAGPQEPAHYQRAADYYKKYIQTSAAEPQPDRDLIYYRWGDCCYRVGDYPGAVTALADIMGTTIAPDMYARSLLLLGECYEKMAAQQTDESNRQYYLAQADQTYSSAIKQNDPFVTQAAKNRKNAMMVLPPG